MDYDKTHKTSAKKHYINKVYDEHKKKDAKT